VIDGDLRYLRDSAQRVGIDISTDQPAVVREYVDTPSGKISWLKWGSGPTSVATVHGGGQNAHTWDSFSFALGRPLVSVDLPGHGHSSWRADRDYLPERNAETLANAFDIAGLSGLDYVGMSLGGLTGIALAAARPDLVRRLILIDVTPGVLATFENLSDDDRGSTTLVVDRQDFESLDAMIDAAFASSPSRTRESLAIGVNHNAKQNGDGSWSWRYDRLSNGNSKVDYHGLWDAFRRIDADVMLVRGGRSRFVADHDAETLKSVSPCARIITIPGAGHSVQGDRPRELATVVTDFANSTEPRTNSPIGSEWTLAPDPQSPGQKDTNS